MKNIIVLGAGMVGSVMAIDLAKKKQCYTYGFKKRSIG